MTDAPNQGKGRGNARVTLALLAVITAAIGVYIARSPQEEGARRIIARMARAVGRRLGKADRAKKPIATIVREIDQGDERQRATAIALLRYEPIGPAEFAQVSPHLIQALKDGPESVREAAASVLSDLILRFGRKAPGTTLEEACATLLDEPSPALRATGARFLGTLAALRRRDVPPARLVACLDDDSEQVRAAAAAALVEYGQGPELFLPVAFRRLPTEGPIAHAGFTRILWNLHFRPTALPLLIEKLSSDNTLVCVSAATVLNHMGLDARPARPAVMALLRKELETPHPRLDLRLTAWDNGPGVSSSGVNLVVVGTDRSGAMHFRIFGPNGRRVTDTDETELRAEAGPIATLKQQVEGLSAPDALGLAGKAQIIAAVTSIVGQSRLNDPNTFTAVDIIEQTSEALVQLSPDGGPLPGTVEVLCEVLKRPNAQRQQAAAWSLGFLGRDARPAVPLLMATFESAPQAADDLRATTALALVEICRGTPDEDRLLACLAKAWTTAPQRQKTRLAHALRGLGPKSEQLVPELRQLPRDDSLSMIRRGRSPRSFLEGGIRANSR